MSAQPIAPDTAQDVAQAAPAAVQHLQMREVLVELRKSTRALARDVGLSPTVAYTLIATGQWPRRRSIPLLRQQILDALRDYGATPEQLDRAFRRYEPVTPIRPARVSRARSTTHLDPEDYNDEDIMLMPKQSLTPAARTQFKLFSNPFDGEVQSAAEMFITPEIRYVREACLQTALNARFMALVGESGSGKTTLLGDLEDRLQSDRRSVMIIRPSVLGMADNNRAGKALKSGDIQTAILQTIDPLSTVAQTSERRTRQVRRALEESTQAGNQHLLVIEEAHDMPVTTLNHLKRLHEAMRLGRRAMIGILLLGHPELINKLRRFDVREVMQRCEIVQLQPLDGALRDYLEHRASLANRKLDELITPDGIDELRTRLTVQRGGANVAPISLVYPLAVHNLLTAAINAAADVGAPVVNRDVVRNI